MTGKEVFRTGIATVEFQEVTAVEVIGKTQGKALLLVRQCLEERSIVGVDIVAHVEHGKGAYIVYLVERT